MKKACILGLMMCGRYCLMCGNERVTTELKEINGDERVSKSDAGSMMSKDVKSAKD